MRNRRTNKQIILGAVFIISLLIILFVGRKFDPETGQRNLTIIDNGVQHFRKGLDVSGGTRLIYRVNYSKYEQIYTNPTELEQIKETIETIILKNIDSRISSLGVSDYRAYVQTLNNEPYIVVEIGGINNLDEAKEVIGKTVELEFRLPNEDEPTTESIAQRQALAQGLLEKIQTNPDLIPSFADDRTSEDIYYNLYTDATINELPQIYNENINILNQLQTGAVHGVLLEGIYHVLNQQATTGSEILRGFTAVKLIDRTIEENITISAEDIVQTALEMDIDVEEVIADEQPDSNINAYTYDSSTDTIIFNAGPVFSGQAAYDAYIVRVDKPTLIGATDEQAAVMEEVAQDKLQEVQDNIADMSITLSGTQVVNEQWISQQEMQGLISSFTGTNEGVQTFDAFDARYVAYIQDSKQADKPLFATLQLTNVNNTQREDFQQNIQTTTRYSLEEVFIRDRESRLPAQTAGGDILNGAYFKYANITTSQVGEPVVTINFDDTGKDIFCDLTTDNVGRSMAIFVGGELITAPTIQAKICGGTAQINGGFTVDTAKELADELNEGTLPAPLILMQEEKISPTLGANALDGALIAALIGIILIIALMRFMYGRRKALVTAGVLIMFITVLFAFMKLIDYALSLSGIAAIILSIGIGVDANILIYERIREELDKKRTMASAIETGYSRSRSPIRDGNISTGLIALLLFTLGVNMFKGFGSMMILNILIILFINVPLTKELLHLIFRKKATYLKDNQA